MLIFVKTLTEEPLVTTTFRKVSSVFIYAVKIHRYEEKMSPTMAEGAVAEVGLWLFAVTSDPDR